MRETYIPHSLIVAIQNVLGKGLRYWFAEIFFSALTVCGTVSSWICNSNEEKRYRKFYHYLQRLGRFDERIQNAYESWLIDALKLVLKKANVVRLALDDSPIKRYGPKIEGAGLMHDPTNATNKNAKCYGHSWVAVSLIVEHPKWGTISLPLRWRFYVRKEKLGKINEAIRPEFKTKLEIGEELVSQSVATIRKVTDKQIQLAFDSGYVSENLLKAMEKLGVKVVTRLKSNANLCELPQKPTEAKRGRPRIYGDVFKLQDWVENDKEEMFRENLELYGGIKLIEYKTMIATTKITLGRPVRLVLSRYVKDSKATDWRVFISSDLNASPQEVLVEYSRRFSIEEMFKDLKTVCGLGSQEVRKWESCKACTTITAMNYTAVEVGTWNLNASELTILRPKWDDKERRPSHKNKRDLVSRKIAFENFSRSIIGAKPSEIRETFLRLARLLRLAV